MVFCVKTSGGASGEATATVVVVDSDSVVSVVDLEEDLGEVKAAEVDSDSGEETAAAGREAPADLDSAARWRW